MKGSTAIVASPNKFVVVDQTSNEQQCIKTDQLQFMDEYEKVIVEIKVVEINEVVVMPTGKQMRIAWKPLRPCKCPGT